ncbi:MAG: PilZ domain-containing protein [Terriglobales bacterium]
MDRRRSPRIAARLPVRIWGMDAYALPFMALVTLNDISQTGARVQGIRRMVKAGTVLEVQLGEEKAQFRVAWVGKAGTQKEGQLGLESLPSEPCIWDVNLGLCNQFAGVS